MLGGKSVSVRLLLLQLRVLSASTGHPAGLPGLDGFHECSELRSGIIPFPKL